MSIFANNVLPLLTVTTNDKPSCLKNIKCLGQVGRAGGRSRGNKGDIKVGVIDAQHTHKKRKLVLFHTHSSNASLLPYVLIDYLPNSFFYFLTSLLLYFLTSQLPYFLTSLFPYCLTSLLLNLLVGYPLSWAHRAPKIFLGA